MNKQTIYIAAVAALGVILISRVYQQSRAANMIGPADAFRNGSDWYEDSWARLHGRDLSVDGEHGAPSSMDPLGLKNEMGWNYAWALA